MQRKAGESAELVSSSHGLKAYSHHHNLKIHNFLQRIASLNTILGDFDVTHLLTISNTSLS